MKAIGCILPGCRERRSSRRKREVRANSMATRREFLISAAAPVAARLSAADAPEGPDREKFAGAALDRARKSGATYADVRINRCRNQSITTRERQVLRIDSSTSFGYGVRVLK